MKLDPTKVIVFDHIKGEVRQIPLAAWFSRPAPPWNQKQGPT